MTGMLPTRIQQIGLMLIKVIICSITIIAVLCGCSNDWLSGDGRGDWTVNICGNYALSKVNTDEIILIQKYESDLPGGNIVIPNYYILAYQVQEPYIFLEGLVSQKMSISAEERENNQRSYFAVLTTDDTIIGPFESYDLLIDYCTAHNLLITDEWKIT